MHVKGGFEMFPQNVLFFLAFVTPPAKSTVTSIQCALLRGLAIQHRLWTVISHQQI